MRGVAQTMVECGRVQADEVLRRQTKQVLAQQVRKSVGRQDFSLELQRVITVKHRARFSKLMKNVSVKLPTLLPFSCTTVSSLL